MKIWQGALYTLVLIVLLAGVHFWVGWDHIGQAWLTLGWQAGVAAVGLLLLSYYVRALRIFYYFHHQAPMTQSACHKLVLNHTAWNNFLPMRSGELAYPLLMKRYFQVDYSRSMASLLWLRLMDLHTLVLCGLALVWTLWPSLWGWGVWGLIAGIPLLSFALKNALRQFNQARWDWLETALDGLPHQWALLLKLWGLTWLNWGFKLGLFVFLIHSMSGLALTQALAAALGGELSSVLPVHGFGGFGTYEAGMLAPLLWLEVDPRQLTATAINVHLLILGASVAGWLIAQTLTVNTHSLRHNQK